MKKVLIKNLVWIMSLLGGWGLMMLALMSGADFAGYIIENGLPTTFWEYSREGACLLSVVLLTYLTVRVVKWGYKYDK